MKYKTYVTEGIADFLRVRVVVWLRAVHACDVVGSGANDLLEPSDDWLERVGKLTLRNGCVAGLDVHHHGSQLSGLVCDCVDVVDHLLGGQGTLLDRWCSCSKADSGQESCADRGETHVGRDDARQRCVWYGSEDKEAGRWKMRM